MKPFFSFIIPSCDVEQYIRECLDSVLSQSFGDWECVVGVETSKDKTEEIVREYAMRDSRIRFSVSPRSGSCSATRNSGTELARGEYIIFLDGDDTIAEGSLERLHRKISQTPGADLYPCVILAHNEMTGEREIRDNYPPDVTTELTGPEATVLLERTKLNPSPMLQFTVFRREFLLEHDLRCIYGLRHQDSEFSPRALFLAKRVVPLHEPYYLYRIRANSVQTKAKGKGYFHRDFAIGLRSLFAFHAKVSKEPGFDRRVSESWARAWCSTLFIKWFSKDFVRAIPRRERFETLKIIFADGFGDFDTLLAAATARRKIAAWWVKFFMRHPNSGWLSELFFTKGYFPLLKLKTGK
ncbi:MAG: glycosyltransferase [Lentisphaeria bacterium]|nr:glycosyltransferase [Lentisphaeria bacterium]